MAKALSLLFSASSNKLCGNLMNATTVSKLQGCGTSNVLSKLFGNNAVQVSRAQSLCTLSAATSQVRLQTPISHTNVMRNPVARLSTEVDKEISKFLDKEIQYEKSRTSDSLPKVPGFDITTDGADLTLTKSAGSEKVVVRLSVNGAVDSLVAEGNEGQAEEEAPQMVCRPPFEVEISKGDGSVLALQCSFPVMDEMVEEAGQQGTDQIDDQFEIQEVAIHGGEWKDTTYSISAATMDAELFDLLMDMLDERGINDEFIAQLVDYCTAYENQEYVSFLGQLKSFSEK